MLHILQSFLQREENATQLRDCPICLLVGEVSANKQSELLQYLQEIDNDVILLATFQVGGVGLNLQMISNVLFLD